MMRRVSTGDATARTCRRLYKWLTCYGPNVTAAATLLAGQDVLSIERAADLMPALLGPRVHRVRLLLPDPLDDALTPAGSNRRSRRSFAQEV